MLSPLVSSYCSALTGGQSWNQEKCYFNTNKTKDNLSVSHSWTGDEEKTISWEHRDIKLLEHD